MSEKCKEEADCESPMWCRGKDVCGRVKRSELLDSPCSATNQSPSKSQRLMLLGILAEFEDEADRTAKRYTRTADRIEKLFNS